MGVKTVVGFCKEEGLSWREALNVLPSMFITFAQQNPGIEYAEIPMEELLKQAKELYAKS